VVRSCTPSHAHRFGMAERAAPDQFPGAASRAMKRAVADGPDAPVMILDHRSHRLVRRRFRRPNDLAIAQRSDGHTAVDPVGPDPQRTVARDAQRADIGPRQRCRMDRLPAWTSRRRPWWWWRRGYRSLRLDLTCHHGTNIDYDRSKQWTAKAVVTEFQYVNPWPSRRHVRVVRALVLNRELNEVAIHRGSG